MDFIELMKNRGARSTLTRDSILNLSSKISSSTVILSTDYAFIRTGLVTNNSSSIDTCYVTLSTVFWPWSLMSPEALIGHIEQTNSLLSHKLNRQDYISIDKHPALRFVHLAVLDWLNQDVFVKARWMQNPYIRNYSHVLKTHNLTCSNKTEQYIDNNMLHAHYLFIKRVKILLRRFGLMQDAGATLWCDKNMLGYVKSSHFIVISFHHALS